MSETPLLDFSSTKPDPIAVEAAGFAGVVGYFKPLQAGGVPNPKELTADYITRARAAGLAVAAVFETTTDRALSGAAGGTADAATARARAAALGYPTSAVCFAAVDEDVTAAQFGTITAYLQAFEAGWGGPAGGYGELDLIEHLAAVAPSLYRWQTEAWSGHRLSQTAHLFQRSKPSGHWKVFAGTDENVLCQPIPWFGAATPAPTPTPPPPAPPTPVRPAYNWTGPDLTGSGNSLRGQAAGQPQGPQTNGPRMGRLHDFLRTQYHLYAGDLPDASSDEYGWYGDKTARVIAEFAKRSGINGADGKNIGPQIAAALVRAGFRG